MKSAQGNKTPGGDIKNSFALPRSIAKALRECAEKHGERGSPPTLPAIRYLWMSIADPRVAADVQGRRARPRFAYEDWLNVVDEAASLGVQYMVICTGVSLGAHPEVWKICRWAQWLHGIEVGIHTRAAKLTEPEITELKRLDKNHTWLFVNKKDMSAFRPLKKDGVKVLEAHVDHEEHSPPCEMSKQMVFVGPQGILYTCGLVLNDDQFRMGHVSEKPLEQFVKDPDLPHTIPKGVPHRESGCDACPPLMVKRMVGRSP
jgi:radical SAM protein with 4Fe4S-binding SPASM domain